MPAPKSGAMTLASEFIVVILRRVSQIRVFVSFLPFSSIDLKDSNIRAEQNMPCNIRVNEPIAHYCRRGKTPDPT